VRAGEGRVNVHEGAVASRPIVVLLPAELHELGLDAFGMVHIARTVEDGHALRAVVDVHPLRSDGESNVRRARRHLLQASENAVAPSRTRSPR